MQPITGPVLTLTAVLLHAGIQAQEINRTTLDGELVVQRPDNMAPPLRQPGAASSPAHAGTAAEPGTPGTTAETGATAGADTTPASNVANENDVTAEPGAAARTGGASRIWKRGSGSTLLPRVTVTATRHEEGARTAPASVSVIERDEIRLDASQDLLNVIETTPGLTLLPRQVSGRRSFSLRGMNEAHTLMLIDGRRISASDDVVGHSDYQYGWAPLSSIERIEIIRGPLSALYGSEALGGVVNLITRWPTEKWEGSLHLSGQRLTDHRRGGTGSKASLYMGGPLDDRLSIRLNGEQSHVGSIRSKTDARYSDIEGRSPGSLGLSARYRANAQHRFEAGWQQGREERYYNDVGMHGVAHQSRYVLDRRHGYLQWNGQFGPTLRTKLRTYRSALDIANTRTRGVSATRPQDLRDSVVDGFIQRRLDRHQLTAGAEVRRETLINAGLSDGREKATHRAIFLQDEVTLNRSLTATLGLRMDDHEFFGNEYSPRAYLVWQAEQDLVIKGGYGTAFKAPTLKQVSPHYVGAEGPHTFHGNADIQPESSKSVELGADWQLNKVSLRGTLFHTRVKDLIHTRLLRRQGIRNIYRYDNLQRATLRGAELGFSWAISPGLFWNNDITLLRTKDDDGQEIAARPRHILQSQLRWRGPWGLDTRVGLTHTGRSQAISTEPEPVRLPSYTTWNASIGQQIDRNIGWRLGMDNIGDIDLAEESDGFGYALRGRSWFAQLQIDF
ncbi:MAG: TonB-dependent receptor [Lautropia sp.]|nr:TonB-dependent receptor [Lautropia sp.]